MELTNSNSNTPSSSSIFIPEDVNMDDIFPSLYNLYEVDYLDPDVCDTDIDIDSFMNKNFEIDNDPFSNQIITPINFQIQPYDENPFECILDNSITTDNFDYSLEANTENYVYVPYVIEDTNYPAQDKELVITDVPNNSQKDDTLKCTICEAIFNDSLPYLLHYEQVHKVFKCPLCIEHFAKQSLLKSHLFVHSNSRDFSCFVCAKTFRRRFGMQKHIRDVHSTKDRFKEIFECADCPFKTSIKSFIRSHVLSHFDGNVCYICEICGLQFPTSKHLVRHTNSHSKVRLFRCTTCGSTFAKEETLSSHIATFHKIMNRFQCDSCGRIFTNEDSFDDHLTSHKRQYTTTTINCDICHKELSNKWALMRHKEIHNNSKEYSCAICGKTYTNETSLQEHSISHIDTKPFVCEHCSKTFAKRKSLLNHIRIHDSNRIKHKCSFCVKSYVSKFKLKSHIQKYHINKIMK